jgi:hypothetical protein
MPLDTALAELEEAGVIPVERSVAWADPADRPDVHVDLAVSRSACPERLPARKGATNKALLYLEAAA